jgi:hypothetical protein
MGEGKRGELSRLNQQCILDQKDFDINSVIETARKASAEAYLRERKYRCRTASIHDSLS